MAGLWKGRIILCCIGIKTAGGWGLLTLILYPRRRRISSSTRHEARGGAGLRKRRVTKGWMKSLPSLRVAHKNADAALQSLAIDPLWPALRALPPRFFVATRARNKR